MAVDRERLNRLPPLAHGPAELTDQLAMSSHFDFIITVDYPSPE